MKKQRPEPLFFVGRPNGRAASFSDSDDARGNAGYGRSDDGRASGHAGGSHSCVRCRDRRHHLVWA